LRRYRRRGADPITRLLLTELRKWPLQGASILDVGGGIGVIVMELADSGAGSATVVEASPAYFDVARSEMESRYGSRPTQFVVGDFARMAPTLSDADVVTLDRVVCCYPGVEDLLCAAVQRARRLIAFSYPRNRWYVRAAIALENWWRRLRGNPFSGIPSPTATYVCSVGGRRLSPRRAIRNSGPDSRPLPSGNGVSNEVRAHYCQDRLGAT